MVDVDEGFDLNVVVPELLVKLRMDRRLSG
jgi:hypothetical protein